MFADLSSKWFAINPLEKAKEEPAPPQPKPQVVAPKKEQPTASAAPAPSPFATTNAPAPSPFSTTSFTTATEAKPPVDSAVKDYHKLLTEFYQKHNPEKVTEVVKNLVKYKGKEPEMFAKLAKKYNTTNPLDDNKAPAPASSSSGGFGFGNMGSSKSPFGGNGGGNQSPFTSAPNTASNSSTSSATTVPTSNTSFGVGGGDKKSPFGATPAPSNSPFNTTSGSVFGGNSFGAAPSPFGGSSIGSAFGSSSAPTAASTPFSSSTFGSSSGSGFGQPPAAPSSAAPSSTRFGGRDPRDILTQFYQTHNPSKVGEVDKLLTKYKGKEEQLFVNLAKKYNLDPAQFGVNINVSQPASSTGAATFGSPAAMGFGASAPVAGGFGGGGGTFGASSGFGSVPQTGGFSSLAGPTPAPSGFGAFGGAAQTQSSPFGGNTPFGSARR